MRRRVFDHVDPYLAPPERDEPQPPEDDLVTDEMIEAGASALALAHDYNPNTVPSQPWGAIRDRYRRDAETVLRAALSETQNGTESP
jgi:hypothetical protein